MGDSGKEDKVVESAPKAVAKSELEQKRNTKEDNRKLVYEDIWDDIPIASASTATTQSSAPTMEGISNAATDSFCPATSFQGSRPGWYFGTGVNGLGYYKDRLQN